MLINYLLVDWDDDGSRIENALSSSGCLVEFEMAESLFLKVRQLDFIFEDVVR